ncbi:MAG: hypothetical protein JHC31_03070 [Sulfurihydrogenibium sp.]|jgi:hypothetical protein|nr:hypothetical protein [Sulfurihydrogenibium sp.]
MKLNLDEKNIELELLKTGSKYCEKNLEKCKKKFTELYKFLYDRYEFLNSISNNEEPFIKFIYTLNLEEEIDAIQNITYKNLQATYYIASYIIKVLIEISPEFFFESFKITTYYRNYHHRIKQEIINIKNLKEELENANKDSLSYLIGSSSINEGFALLEKRDLVRLLLTKKILRQISLSMENIYSFIEKTNLNYNNLDLSRKEKDLNYIYDKLSVFADFNMFKYKKFNKELLYLDFSSNNKVDIYIDTSASMSSPIKIINNEQITKLSLATSIAITLKDKINDLYFFASSVKKTEKENLLEFLLRVIPAGGTNIKKALENINETKQKSIIITDGKFTKEEINPSNVKLIIIDKELKII